MWQSSMKPPYPARRIHGFGSEEEHKTMKQTCHFDYGDSFFGKYMFIELLWLWWNKPDKPASEAACRHPQTKCVYCGWSQGRPDLLRSSEVPASLCWSHNTVFRETRPSLTFLKLVRSWHGVTSRVSSRSTRCTLWCRAGMHEGLMYLQH